MESLRELYKVGNGPSSSHTMGPARAAKVFMNRYKEAASFEAILYGSLAATGEGHLTDYIIIKTTNHKMLVPHCKQTSFYLLEKYTLRK